MQYALVVTKCKNRELYKMYEDYDKVKRKLKKSFAENGEILEIPEISAGLRLYKKSGDYYGTIIKETKSLWLIDNTDSPGIISTPIMKDNIINWFVKGVFLDGISEYDEKFKNEYYHNEDDELEEMMDEMEKDVIGIN